MKIFKESTTPEQINRFFDLAAESGNYLSDLQVRTLDIDDFEGWEELSVSEKVIKSLDKVLGEVEKDPAKHFMAFLNSFDQKALRDIIEEVCPFDTTDLDTKDLKGKASNSITVSLIEAGKPEDNTTDFPEEEVRKFWDMTLGMFDPTYYYNLRDLITELTEVASLKIPEMQ